MPLQEKLTSGEFVILAEMDPPKGTDVSDMVGAATTVKRMVDAFVVPEMNNAVMRLSSLGGALLLQSKGLDRKLPIIITADENNPEQESRIRQQGIFYYHVNSFGLDDLILAISNAMVRSSQ